MARSFDSADMASRGRIGAAVTHSRYDSRDLTAKARATFTSKFAQEVDPDEILPLDERLRRAEHARHAHYLRMARISAQRRRKAA